MNVAVRSSLTAGVALATAGALVASPIAPVPPDIKVPAVHADVALTAVPNRLLTAQLAAPAQAAEAIIDAEKPTASKDEFGFKQSRELLIKVTILPANR